MTTKRIVQEIVLEFELTVEDGQEFWVCTDNGSDFYVGEMVSPEDLDLIGPEVDK